MSLRPSEPGRTDVLPCQFRTRLRECFLCERPEDEDRDGLAHQHCCPAPHKIQRLQGQSRDSCRHGPESRSSGSPHPVETVLFSSGPRLRTESIAGVLRRITALLASPREPSTPNPPRIVQKGS